MRTLDPGVLDALRRARAEHPERIAEALSTRTRRPLVDGRGDGRLLIVAADHPARGALGAGVDPLTMADRGDLLDRLATALADPGVDGVLGTPDVVDDLALLGLLDDRVVVGSMNRGGLRGAAFELDDRFTAYDTAALVRCGIDAGKTLLRIDLDDPATASVLESTGRVVTETALAGIPILVEPFLSTRDHLGNREGAGARDGVGTRDGGSPAVVNDLTTDAVIRSAAIASGLGASSAYTWLKLPVVADMARVTAATTLPILLLGGETSRDPDALFSTWRDALALPGVRGLTVGRNLLYPPDDDVAGAIAVAADLVHGSSQGRSRESSDESATKP